MDFLILASLFITSSIAAILPVENALTTFVPAGFTAIRLFSVGRSPNHPVFVPENGTLFDPNPSVSLIKRVCIDHKTPSCAFGAENGTWVAAYNTTNNGCVDISPPLVLTNGFCCVSLDNCTVLDQPFQKTRDEFSSDGVTVVELYGQQAGFPYYLAVENNVAQMDFNPSGALIDRVCMLTMNTLSCGFGAKDIYATWVQVYNNTDYNCFNLTDPAPLSSVSCCTNKGALCPALDGPFSERARRDVGNVLQARQLKRDGLHILYDGPPDLSALEDVPMDESGFNVTMRVPWAVGQICLQVSITSVTSIFPAILTVLQNSNTAICAFTATDNSSVVVIATPDNNCVVLGPPRTLTVGCCCPSLEDCGTNRRQTINQAVGSAILASIAGKNTSDTVNIASNASIGSRELKNDVPSSVLPKRSINTIATPITVQYFGAENAYDSMPVSGNFTPFQPPSWSVEKVCILSPSSSGGCGWFNSDYNPVAGVFVTPGQTVACSDVGTSQVFYWGICCDPASGCYLASVVPALERLMKPISVRDTTEAGSTAPVNRRISFSSDPAF